MPTFGTYLLEVNWDGDATDFATGVWTDEISRHVSSEWGYGRDYASQLTGRAIAGELVATLKDQDGRFASFNAASALTGKIKPARRVRLRTTAPSAATLWAGFLDTITPLRDRERGSYAALSCYGPIGYCARRDAAVGVKTNRATGAAVGDVLDDVGWPAADRTLDTGQITMTRWAVDKQNSLSALRELEETEWGFLGESKAGHVVWEDVHHRLKTPHTASQATFSDAIGAALPYVAPMQRDAWREIHNDFEASVQLWDLQLLAVLWTDPEVTSVPALGSRDLWVEYPTPSSPEQADHVDAWTTPVATTDYVANSASDGTGSDLTASVTVAVSKFPRSMKITLTNAHASLIAYLTTLRARGTAAYRRDLLTVKAADPASQTAYGKRSYSLGGKFYPTSAVALAYCQYGLSRYKEPRPVLEITFRADWSAAHMTEALTRAVSDRITVVASGTGASGAQLGLSRDFFVEAIRHRLSQAGHWITYVLSDATGDEYWALGSSPLGTGTKLAP